MSSLLWLTVLVVLLLGLSSRVRSAIFNRCLFPCGYFLYTQRVPGYTLHKAVFMSSSSNPKTAHTKVDRATTDGSGDSEVQVVPVPLLDDNYAYVLLHAASRTAALVDPADPHPVLKLLQEKYSDYQIHTILTTHKHWDHAGGNLELVKQFPHLQVVGGRDDGVAGATIELGTGDVVEMASPHFRAQVFQCPCHTRGHVIFKVGRLLFTGDTLFSGGCGKFFEGNAAEMYKNLYQTIGTMPDDTIVFPGHEYTVSNLEFAAWVEPSNEALQQRLVWARERRAGLYPTIPSTIGEEKAFNPFMRVQHADVVARVQRAMGTRAPTGAGEQLAVQVMDALRTLKNENAHKK